jgi:hypothetical protein
MNRRELLKSGLSAATIAAVFHTEKMSAQAPVTAPSGDTIYLNPATGADGNSGAKGSPIRTLGEAGRRVSQSTGTGPMTVVLSKGIYAVGETMLLKPQKRTFSAIARLTVRAEFLPDDPGWTADGMPTLIFTIPFTDPPTWNGRPNAAGGAVDGILIETSHVSILGLKFLGLPVLEGPRPGIERRLYGINRTRREFDDLEIGHCMFLGDLVTNPIDVAIIANGNGIDIHHTIFRENTITVVYWQGGSKGHALRNCVITGCYGSGLWTAGIAADFRFANNVVDDCRYVWTYQNAAAAPPFLCWRFAVRWPHSQPTRAVRRSRFGRCSSRTSAWTSWAATISLPRTRQKPPGPSPRRSLQAGSACRSRRGFHSRRSRRRTRPSRHLGSAGVCL